MILLERLGSDRARARFIESLIPLSLKGFAGCPMKVTGACDSVSAYFMLVGVCNELGADVNEVAKKLDKVVSAGCHPLDRGVPRSSSDIPCGVCPRCGNVTYESDFFARKM
jgi:hypothetical protein